MMFNHLSNEKSWKREKQKKIGRVREENQIRPKNRELEEEVE